MLLSGKILYDNVGAPQAGVYVSDAQGNFTNKSATKTDMFGNYKLDISKALPNDYVTYAYIASRKIVPISALRCTPTGCSNSVALTGNELEEVTISPQEQKTEQSNQSKCTKKCKTIIGIALLLAIVATTYYIKTRKQ
jgi:hypothetical protein